MNTPKEGGGEHTETDTRHKAQAGGAGRDLVEGGPRARQAASGQLTLGMGKTGRGWGGTTRYREHGTYRDKTKTSRHRPGGQEESRCQGGVRAPARNQLETGPSSDPFRLQYGGSDQCGPPSPVVRFTCLQGLRSTGLSTVVPPTLSWAVGLGKCTGDGPRQKPRP